MQIIENHNSSIGIYGKELTEEMEVNGINLKISEAQLKQMISESVKNVLSELDWKTYANAAAAAKDREKIYLKIHQDTLIRQCVDIIMIMGSRYEKIY